MKKRVCYISPATAAASAYYSLGHDEFTAKLTEALYKTSKYYSHVRQKSAGKGRNPTQDELNERKIILKKINEVFNLITGNDTPDEDFADLASELHQLYTRKESFWGDPGYVSDFEGEHKISNSEENNDNSQYQIDEDGATAITDFLSEYHVVDDSMHNYPVNNIILPSRD